MPARLGSGGDWRLEERRVTVTRDSHTLLTLTRLRAGPKETEIYSVDEIRQD